MKLASHACIHAERVRKIATVIVVSDAYLSLSVSCIEGTEILKRDNEFTGGTREYNTSEPHSRRQYRLDYTA